MKNIIKKINLTIVGGAILALGVLLLVVNVISVSKLQAYSKDNSNNRYQYIHANISYKQEAVDEDLNVSAPSSILIRTVEMVQYYKDSDGVRLVLSNHQLDSFKDNGVEYNNPDMSSILPSMIFYSDTYIGNDGLKLDDNAIEQLVYNDEFEKVQLVGLNDIDNEYGLISNDNCYISGNDEWNLGDIKVTYYYLNTNSDPITVVGKISDDVIKTDVRKAFITTNNISLQEANKSIHGIQILYYLLILVGLIIMLLPKYMVNIIDFLNR